MQNKYSTKIRIFRSNGDRGRMTEREGIAQLSLKNNILKDGKHRSKVT